MKTIRKLSNLRVEIWMIIVKKFDQGGKAAIEVFQETCTSCWPFTHYRDNDDELIIIDKNNTVYKQIARGKTQDNYNRCALKKLNC